MLLHKQWHDMYVVHKHVGAVRSARAAVRAEGNEGKCHLPVTLGHITLRRSQHDQFEF